MAMERNSHSILAKLMGIDRQSPSHTNHERGRVLSENYFQNIASLAHRQRAPLNLHEDDFSMVVDGCPDNQRAVEYSKGDAYNTPGLYRERTNSSGKNKLKGVRLLAEDQRFELVDGFDLQGTTNSSSRFSVLSSSCSSAGKNLQSSKAQIQQVTSTQKWNKQTGESQLRGKAFSSPSSLVGDRERRIAGTINSKRRRVKSLDSGANFPLQGSLFRQEIAKHIDSQVKNSVWHSYIDVSRSGSISDKSFVNEHEHTTPSSSYSSVMENKHEAAYHNRNSNSASIDTPKAKKQLSERWTRKCSQEVRTSRRRELQDGVSFMYGYGTKSVPHWSTRYLSKPTLFPSAWIPRSRIRHFELDRNWSLRPGERHNMIHGDSTVNKSVHEDLRSTSEPKLDNSHPSAPKTPGMSEEQHVLEEVLTARESFGETASFSDVESPTYHDACIVIDKERDRHPKEHVADEGNKKNVTCIEIKKEQLPAEPSTCILLQERGSDFQDFHIKDQCKDNTAFEPRSPVSSLEGPEACRIHPDLTLGPKEISLVAECLDNNVQGLRTKFHFMETMSLESGSEGSGMRVSSDDEGDEGSSIGCYREDTQIMELYGTLENRDFSYLVDVLVESGIVDGNMEMESKPWGLQGNILSSVVFDSLEKKYGKQTIWERSERRLLFDRINSGLVEIAQPLVGINTWRKPVVKRLAVKQDQETIEEELWAALVIQEEKSQRESSDKLCRREIEWLELEEDTDSIVQQLEFLLIDELIEEFVSMEVFRSVPH